MKLSETEWVVMNAVWDQSPVSVRDVHDQVIEDTGWAYTTVKTILVRLVEKGVLRVHKRANTSLFEPIITRKQARRSAVRSLVDRAFDGTLGSLFPHRVADEKLSRRDRERLNTLLEGTDRPGGKTR